jgi:hypothetical protein
MSNNVFLARMVGTWCMSVMTIGAWSIVSGAALTIPNGVWLLGACVVPPLIVLLVCRHAAPFVVTVATETLDGPLPI